MLILPSILFGAFFTLAVAWMLGNICVRRLPVPATIALAIGAAVESTIVFLMLVCGVGGRVEFCTLGAIALALYLWLGRAAPRIAEPPSVKADRVTWWLAMTALAFYAGLYFINALAPELEPDARAYHLGFTAEYVRLGGFPDRVGFFEMVPQGFEMLFVPAFAFGKHSAARLVHLAFLLATVPLMLHIVRRLALPQYVALGAAVLYFCSPIAGITGTSAYTDAGAVFFTLAVFCLLLVWRDTRDLRYLAPAGIAAGFCYAIKFPGALVTILAMAFVVAIERRIRVRQMALLGGGALLVAAPWLLRNAIMTGNPAAPLFNRIFPNPYFHLMMEKELGAVLGSLWGISPWKVPYELVVGGTLGGAVGLAFFALPIGMLALRKRAGRLCWLAAALLALPWFWNTGARFLMPALPFLAIALAMALPRRALWACVAVQAIGCWPQIYKLYHPGYAWRLERIPWRAALRIQPEQDYLEKVLPAYPVARLIQDHTALSERIFSLVSVAIAYTDRQVLEFWHSAQAENLTDALRAAAAPNEPRYDVSAEWTPRALRGLRIRTPQASRLEWMIPEIKLFLGRDQVVGGPEWQLTGWPNEWDLPRAFDENPATRWRSWEPIQRGMYVEVDFDQPQTLSGAVMTSQTAVYPVPFDFYGREADGWHLLTSHPVKALNPLRDLRLAAANAVHRAGFAYILADDGNQGNALLGADLAARASDWGVEKVAAAGSVILFRIR